MDQTSQRPKPVVLRRVVWLLLLVCGSLYLLVCVGMAIAQRSLVYFPSVFTHEQVDQMAQSARLERWTNSAGEFIGLRRSSPKQPAEGTVMLMYGNGSTAIGCEHYADDIQSVAAFDVFILEYPGYEDRPGSARTVCSVQPMKHFARFPPTGRFILLANRSAVGLPRIWPELIPTKSQAPY